MKSIRLFFVGLVVASLSFLASTSIPKSGHATQKSVTTGEYPEAEGARCTDVEYVSRETTGNEDDTTFVMSPNPNGPTMGISGYTWTRSPKLTKVQTPSRCRDFLT